MIPKEFNAFDFEIQHDRDFQQSVAIPIEISSHHNYSEGMTFFYVESGSWELGYYYKSPWRDIWMAFSNRTGVAVEAATQDMAISLIQKSWEF